MPKYLYVVKVARQWKVALDQVLDTVKTPNLVYAQTCYSIHHYVYHFIF